MGNNKLKQFLYSALIAATIVLTSIIPAFAYTVVKSGQNVQYGGKTYYYNNISGVGAYSRYSAALFGNRNQIKQTMIDDMPEISISSGGTAGSAAFRFTGFGGTSQYVTKLAAMNPHKRNRNSGAEDYQWLNPPFDIGGDTKVSFRYAGIGLTDCSAHRTSRWQVPRGFI